MPSPHAQSHGSMLEPCKLYLILSLFLLTLPSLFVSLIAFSILAFFMLLPIASALFITYLLASILSRIPIYSFDEKCTPKAKVDTIEDQKPECIEFDSSEIPKLDDSSTSSTDEQEKFLKELEEMDQEEFCRLLERFGSVQREGFMSFYEVLSFWRSKESHNVGKWQMK